MFEDLFIDRGTIARYRCAPLLEERLSYLRHCAETGVRPCTLRRIAARQTSLVHLLDLREAERVSMPRIEAAADGRSSRPVRPNARQSFVGHAVRWAGASRVCSKNLARRDMPTSAKSRSSRRGCVKSVDGPKRRSAVAATRSTASSTGSTNGALPWIRSESPTSIGLSRAGTPAAAAGSRSIITRSAFAPFFRFAEHQGWCTPGLTGGIMPSRFHPGETIPKGLSRDEVLRLLATSEGDRPVDLRDRAILMVLIAYGLRSGEVTGLRLDDVDWAEETLRVRRPKPGRTHQYPLSRGVGQAIVRYITDVRPPRPERTLFLTLRAPIRPLGRGTISSVVRRRLDRLGITGTCRGPHALRHAAAQHLLDHGLSMKEVGDYLGHRSISSTAVYAKVQLGTLREVANIDLEGLA